jgi:hypothetical protein
LSDSHKFPGLWSQQGPVDKSLRPKNKQIMEKASQCPLDSMTTEIFVSGKPILHQAHELEVKFTAIPR